MLQEIPLSEKKRAAVEEGITAMEERCQQLATDPTPAEPTPHPLAVVQQGPTLIDYAC